MGEGGEFNAKTSNAGNEYGATGWYLNFALLNAMFGASGVFTFNEWSPMGIDYYAGSVTHVNPLEYAMVVSSQLMNGVTGGRLLASNVTGLSGRIILASSSGNQQLCLPVLILLNRNWPA